MPVSTPFNVLSGGLQNITPSGGVPVGGPGSSTDNAIVRWDGTGGNLVQNSVLIVADTTGALSGFTSGNGITFHGGGTVTGASGSLDFTASGTNQSITLTPSGTGGAKVVSASTNHAILDLNGTGGASLQVYLAAASGQFGTVTNHALVFLTNNAERGRFSAAGNLLLGGLATDGAGVLQFPAATTSAGGIAFGTDFAAYRLAAGDFAFDRPGAANTNIRIRENGAAAGTWNATNGVISFGSDGTNSLRLLTNNTAALTLDTSQNALFSSGSNGQSLNVKHLTELTTIAAAATTDTTIQMPAGAIVLSVSVRVTVVIPTATSFSVGDSGSATRFSTANVNVAANSTDVGTKAGAYYNASALSVRLTMNGGTPADNSGRVRVTIAYLDCTVPTS